MKFTIDQSIFELFPDVQIGIVVAKECNNRISTDKAYALLEDESARTRILFQDIKLSDQENIKAWRRAYTLFGGTSDYRCSIEALCKRAKKGRAIPSINPLVDIYNSVSLKYMLPVGGEDRQAIQGNMILKRASGTERFIPLGEKANEPPRVGEVVYCDDNGDVLCRRWNWREADKSKITSATTQAIFMIEGIPPTNAIEIKEACSDFSKKIELYCDAKTKMYLANSLYPVARF